MRVLAAILVLALLLVLPVVPAAGYVTDVERVAGGDRIATAVAASAHGFDQAGTVVIARADDFADALSAGPLARTLDAPLLLSARDALPTVVADEILRLGATQAIVVGGEAVVAGRVAEDLTALGLAVERLFGPDRFATAAAVAGRAGAPAGEVLVALGAPHGTNEGWADALSAAAFGMLPDTVPLLLTAQDHLPGPTAAVLADLAPSTVTVIGGPAAVSEAVVAELTAAVPDTRRVHGDTRYATSAAVLRDVASRPGFAGVTGIGLVAATGANYPDGLTAGALTGPLGAGAVLVPPTDLEGGAPSVATIVEELAPLVDHAVLLGGPSAVDEGVRRRLAELLAAPVGSDPAETPTPTETPTPDPGPTPTTPLPDPGPGPDPDPDPDPEPTPVDTPTPTETETEPEPDPVPVLPPAGFTAMATAARAVWSGPDAPQQGVADGTLDDERVALLRGFVTDRDGTPLTGVGVSVLDHPELGTTTTGEDGSYLLAVNGGGSLTVVIDGDGYLVVQRTVDVEWREWTIVDTVILTALDTASTVIDLAAGGTHQSTPATDNAGTRQATVIVPAGVTAELTFDDGSPAIPASSLTVRATEFTVGDTTDTGNDAEAAMPGELPPMSGFTYALELTADEAIAAGADGVAFSVPVALYVDNFLGFDVGEVVPFGFYDRTDAAWEPEADGRIVGVVDVQAGSAVLDLDGDGDADGDDDAIATVLGITDAELAQLGALYAAGDELWRVTVDHFSSYDCNWGFGPPSGSGPPGGGPGGGGPGGGGRPRRSPPRIDPCRAGGSIIDCQTQELREALRLAGTDVGLGYGSLDKPGHTADSTLVIPLGDDLHPDLLKILLRVDIGGHRTELAFDPIPGQTHEVVWDGVDALGRQTTGYQRVDYSIAYVYPGVYRSGQRVPAPDQNTFSFALIGNEPLSGNQARAQISMTSNYSWLLRSPEVDPGPGGLGGWNLDVHHSYDAVGGVLTYGDGTRHEAEGIAAIIRTVAGDGTYDGSGDGGPATEASLGGIRDLAVGPDGSIYLADAVNNVIRRIGPDGVINVIAGTGVNAYSGDGPALTTGIGQPLGVAVDDDGTVYFTQQYAEFGDDYAHLLRKIEDGQVVTVAGQPTPGYPDNAGDGGPAVDATLSEPSDVVVGPDGSVYVLTTPAVRQIINGQIFTIAGGGGTAPAEDVQATDVDFNISASSFASDDLEAIALDGDGQLVLAGGGTIWRVRADGGLQRVAGTGSRDYTGDDAPAVFAQVNTGPGIAVAPDGSIHFVQRNGTANGSNTTNIRTIDPDGAIRTTAGTGNIGNAAKPAGEASVGSSISPRGIVVRADGTVLFGNSYFTSSGVGSYVHEIAPAMPSFEGNGFRVADPDAARVHLFDADGVHQQTLDARTGEPVWTFGYDANGLLVTATDAAGEVLTIQRDADGRPTAIVAPGGETTTLVVGAAGYLESVTAPDGLGDAFTYDGGLLTGHTDRRGDTSAYTFDAEGRLASATDPSGATQTYGRWGDDGDFTVTRTDPDGQQTSYRTESGAGGSTIDTVTGPAGEVTTLETAANGDRVLTRPDGSTREVSYNPDPRYGMQAPYPSTTVDTIPRGGDPDTGCGEECCPPEECGEFASATFAAAGDEEVSKTETAQIEVEIVPGGDPTDPQDLQRIVVTITEELPEDYKSVVYDWRVLDGVMTITYNDTLSQTLTFDAEGRVVSFDPGDGQDTYFWTHDDQGRILTETLGTAVTTVDYDDVAATVKVTFPDGEYLEYAFDEFRELTGIDAGKDSGGAGGDAGGSGSAAFAAATSGASLSILRDAEGNITSTTTPSGGAHTQSWSSRGELLTAALPGGAATTHAYLGQRGVRDQTTLPTGEVIDYTHTDGRVSGVTYPGFSESWTWTDGRLASTSWTPDAGAGQTVDTDQVGDVVVSRTWSGAATGSYAYYYGAGLVPVGLVFGAEDRIDVGYDSLGSLSQLGPYSVTHGADGLPAALDDGTSSLAYRFSTLGDVLGRTLNNTGVVGDVASVALVRDDSGIVTDQTITVGASTEAREYGYDDAGRLTSVTVGGSVVESYGYDVNGNLVSRQIGADPSMALAFDSGDRVVTAGGEAYGYDEAGRLVSRGTDTFDVTAEGDIVSAVVGGATVAYTYDALGRRTSRTEGADTTQLFHGDLGNDLLVTATIDPDGTVTEFVYDELDTLVALRRDGEWFTVLVDAIGSPIAVMDGAGTVVKEIAYTAYGEIVSESGWPLALGFAGGLHDRATGLVRLGLRDYDPVTARWLAPDPAGFEAGSTNLYGYADQSPVSRVDVSGALSVGTNFYFGPGGGVSLSLTPDGVRAFCAEVGVGVGGGIGLGDLNETQAPPKDSVVTEAGIGPLSATKDVSPCGIGGTNVGLAPGLELGGKIAYQKCIPF